MTTTPTAYVTAQAEQGSGTGWGNKASIIGPPDDVGATLSLVAAASKTLLLTIDYTKFTGIGLIDTISDIVVTVRARVDTLPTGTMKVGLYSGTTLISAEKDINVIAFAAEAEYVEVAVSGSNWGTFINAPDWVRRDLKVGIRVTTGTLSNLEVDDVATTITYTATAARTRKLARGSFHAWNNAGQGGAPEYLTDILQMRSATALTYDQNGMTLLGSSTWAAMIDNLHVQAYNKGSGSGKSVQSFIDSDIATAVTDTATLNTSPTKEHAPFWTSGFDGIVMWDLDGQSQPVLWRYVYTAVARNTFYREWSWCNALLGAGVNESNITADQITYLFAEYRRVVIPCFVAILKAMQAYSANAYCGFQTSAGGGASLARNMDPVHTLMSGSNAAWISMSADNDTITGPVQKALDFACSQCYLHRRLATSVTHTGYEISTTEAQDLFQAATAEVTRISSSASIGVVALIHGGRPTLAGVTSYVGLHATPYTPSALAVNQIAAIITDGDCETIGDNGLAENATAYITFAGTTAEVSTSGYTGTPNSILFKALGTGTSNVFIMTYNGTTSVEVTVPAADGTAYMTAAHDPYTQFEADTQIAYLRNGGATSFLVYEALNDSFPAAAGSNAITSWVVDQWQPGRELLALAIANAISGNGGRGLGRGRFNGRGNPRLRF